MAISRRKLLALTGGTAAVAAAYPTLKYADWAGKEFGRADYDPNLPDAPAGETGWMNWSGLQRATPQQIFVPKTEGELAQFMRDTQASVRPVGAGHSFTALVPSEGAIVDISRLSDVISHDVAAGTVTVGAGLRLRRSSQKLAKLGMAWPNLPDIDVQTLAGAFSTATHGTGLHFQAIHDQIEGFRLVTPAGEIIDVTRASHPDLFSAGKVSLGALGIITQYTLKMVKSYNLRRRMWIEPIDDLVNRAEEYVAQHRNFEFYFVPNTGYGAGISHDLHDGPVTGKGQSEDDTLLQDLAMLRDQLGWAPWLRRKTVQAMMPTGVIEDVSDESWRLLATSRPMKFNEMEYHLPVEEGLPTLRKVISYLDSRKDVYYPVEVRWTGADDAMLSPFNDGPRLSIATHADAGEAFAYLLDDIQPLHRAAGGRPHWGKLHTLGQAELRGLYPQFDRFNQIRRELDPTGKMLNPHLAKLFGEEV